MTICFNGCDYKYETESVTKLFFPFEHFGFVFDGENISDENRIVISEKNGILTVNVNISGKASEKQCAAGNTKSENEHRICSCLFLILSDMTGIKPKWGCLTGIRPVKKAAALVGKGMTEEEICSYLKENYFTDKSKSKLAYGIYLTQRKALERLKDNSFSLYIGIPFCPTRCSYCSFVSHSIKKSGAKLIPEYVEKLCRELEITADISRRLGLEIDTVYIGGGTPTAISAEELEKIMKKTAEVFDISRISEYTVEAGRADTITEEKLKVIKYYGAERISVNPQTMNDSVLEAIGRQHTAEQFIKSYELARRVGFKYINTDVIAGLPTDTVRGFRHTVDSLIALDPENITVHTLTVKRSAGLFSHSEEIKQNISSGSVEEMTEYALEALTVKGYYPYYLYRQKNTVGNLENTGYAKKGCESLYNIYIMDETQTILAAGAGASSKLTNRRTGEICRAVNYKYPYEYLSDFDKMTEKKNRIVNDFICRSEDRRKDGGNLL